MEKGKDTCRDNQRKVEFKALVKTLANTLAEVKAKTVCDTLTNVEAEVLMDTTVRERIIPTC